MTRVLVTGASAGLGRDSVAALLDLLAQRTELTMTGVARTSANHDKEHN